jgi:hypothetical protein
VAETKAALRAKALSVTYSPYQSLATIPSRSKWQARANSSSLRSSTWLAYRNALSIPADDKPEPGFALDQRQMSEVLRAAPQQIEGDQAWLTGMVF